MTLLLTVLLPLSVFLGAWWLTGRVRRYALAHQLLDVPNARSSHAVATPRGGGIAIVLTTLSGFLVLGTLGALSRSTVVGPIGGGVLVGLVGFMDDHTPLARRWRLVGHFAAAAWVLVWLGGWPSFPVFSFVPLSWVRRGLGVLYLVWLVNLTNFMDGIDGIAGVEVITVCLGGALLYLFAVPGTALWFAPIVLASATMGFLFWNWPPAKIFMGDSGSGFLGLMLATFSLQAALVAPRLFWSWVILLGAFVVDATVTLVRRMARRERIFEGHRSHAYQHAAQRWAAHQPVTLAVGAINLCWLLPVALLVASASLDGLLGVLIAYSPLVAAALWLRAGTSQSQSGSPSPSFRSAIPPLLTFFYVCFATVLFGAYAYTLWTNQHDPGRVNAWIIHVRNSLNGVH